MLDPPILIVVLVVLVTVIGGFWVVIRRVGQVHEMVNSHHDALLVEVRRLLNREDQLGDSLTEAGLPIPDRPDEEEG